MEVWVDEKRPKVMSAGNLVLAVLVHLVFFLGCYMVAKVNFRPKESVIPIDLEIIVNENLDGNENEPPPLDDPPPPPPKPPEPKIEPPPPPPPPEPKVEAVVQVKDAPKKPEVKKPEKKPEEKKPPEEKEPEPPKKTAEQLRKERMEQMVKNAKKVRIKVPDRPSGNGRTEKQPLTQAQILESLNKGYKPSTRNQLAASEEQYCVSLIQRAYEGKWDQVGRPPWSDTLRVMHLKVRFLPGGRVRDWTLVQSSGDAKADQTVRRAAAMVSEVVGLSDAFISKNKDGVIVRFKVTP